MASNEEALEGRVLLGVRWGEMRHVDIVEIDESLDLLFRLRSYFLSFYMVVSFSCQINKRRVKRTSNPIRLVRVQPEEMRAIDPFSQRIKQQQQLDFLEQRLLLTLQSACPAVDGQPSYFAVL